MIVSPAATKGVLVTSRLDRTLMTGISTLVELEGAACSDFAKSVPGLQSFTGQIQCYVDKKI